MTRNLLALVAVAVVSSASLLSAQTNPTGNASDVTGAPTTGGDIAGAAFARTDAGTGTNPTLVSPRAQAAVASTARTATAQLNAGNLTTTTGASILAPAQTAVSGVLTATSVNAVGVQAVQTTLSTALGSSPAASAVPALMTSLAGLASNPAQLPSAIGSLNEIIANAPADFILNPPPEFQAIVRTLALLSAAATAAGGPPT